MVFRRIASKGNHTRGNLEGILRCAQNDDKLLTSCATMRMINSRNRYAPTPVVPKTKSVSHPFNDLAFTFFITFKNGRARQVLQKPFLPHRVRGGDVRNRRVEVDSRNGGGGKTRGRDVVRCAVAVGDCAGRGADLFESTAAMAAFSAASSESGRRRAPRRSRSASERVAGSTFTALPGSSLPRTNPQPQVVSPTRRWSSPGGVPTSRRCSTRW